MPISRTCAAGTPSIRWPSISRGVSACSMARRVVAIHAVSTTATIAATSHTIGDLYQGSARTARAGTSIATGTFMSATLAHTIRIQPRGDGSRFLFAQAPAPRGHHTGSAVTNRCCYACEVAAVKPYIVRQVRCAELRNTPAIHSMTGDAHAGVTGSTGFDPRCGHLPSAQAHHVGNEIDDAFRAKRRAPRRHHPVAAVQDALLHRLRIAAVDPIGIGQARRAQCLIAGRGSAGAGRATVRVETAAYAGL